MQHAPSFDARYFQVIFQAFFLSYGLVFLHWNADWLHFILSIAGCLFFNYLFECVKRKTLLPALGNSGWQLWGFSILISAMSLCLLLKTGHWYTSLLAALLTVASKYVCKINGKHIFNPSAFGIVATLLLTNDAWLSPAQWGSNAVIFFTIITLGTIVVTRVQKLDVSLAFLLTFVGLLYWRQVLVLGWPMDHFLHSISTGSFLLFIFFMISDPKTSPDHPIARIIWAVVIASVAFYLAAFKWKYNTMLWVLVCMAPLLPLLNSLFKAVPFRWQEQSFSLHIISFIKKISMKPLMKKLSAFMLLAAMVSHDAVAFCGFYVSKADGTLKNKTSQVIMVRDGERNVITMYNDFQGNFKEFAMVVPVPVVLKKEDIRVVDQQIFQRLNDYSKPRLVEYYDENPCELKEFNLRRDVPGIASSESVSSSVRGERKRDLGVKIEAKYLVGEYDILILSAKLSSGLKTWLIQNGYKLPPSAEEVLQPYIKSNMKFFVVKVNEKELNKLSRNFLQPIQITFDSPKFMLPIRLGMANADGDQDMIVYAFTKHGRVESTNYRTVELPTGTNIPLFVKDNFSSFYSNLYQHQWRKEGKSVAMLEYSWDVTPQSRSMKCDPCVAAAPAPLDLLQAGVWWANENGNTNFPNQVVKSGGVHFTRLHIRYNRQSFPQDLQFQVTPNRATYQARYVVTHPATGSLDCEQGKAYVKQLKQRRQAELEALKYLTGKSFQDWDLAEIADEEEQMVKDASYKKVASWSAEQDKRDIRLLFATAGVLGLVSFIGLGLKLS
jgi:hypothetical protein